MIDTKALRRLAQAALIGPDGVSMRWLKLLKDFQEEANPAAVSELLDRLEAAESVRRDDYQNWMTALDRNAELLAKLEAAEKELVELRLGISKQQSLTDAAQQLAEAAQRRADKLSARAEEAEKERDDVAQQLVQSEIGKREISEAHNVAKRRLSALAGENIALQAKIEQMEGQKPVGKFIQHPSNGLWEQDGYGDSPDARPLYDRPGAQGEKK